MKLFIFCLGLINFCPASFASDLDEVKEIGFDLQDQTLDFSFTFLKAEEIVWMVFGIDRKDLTTSPQIRNLSVRLYDTKSQTYITDWYPRLKNSKAYYEVVGFNFPLDGIEAKKVIANLPSIVLVVSVNNSDVPAFPTHKIDIGRLCQSHPKHFINADTEIKGCF